MDSDGHGMCNTVHRFQDGISQDSPIIRDNCQALWQVRDGRLRAFALIDVDHLSPILKPSTGKGCKPAPQSFELSPMVEFR
jgi:hypothetical protein